MNVFDFVTQDELDELPEDAQLAFSKFVQIAQRRLSEYTEPRFASQEQSDWDEGWEARYSFVNIVIAAARRLDIKVFEAWRVPEFSDLTLDRYRQFIADIDHFTTQLALDTSFRSRNDSTRIPETSKNRIRTHLHHLREAVDSANLTDAKKATLKDKIAEFEKTLEKSRLPFLAMARLTVEILAVPGALWVSYEITTKLIGNIQQTVAEAKAVDDEERKLPPTPKPYVIAPPRTTEPEPKRYRQLDDEIPF